MRLIQQKYILVGGLALASMALVLASLATKLKGPDPVTVPGQTAVRVTLNRTLTSDQNRPGDHFEATVAEPVVVEDKTAIPEGAEVEGRVVDARRSGGLTGRARLRLALQSVAVDGKTYEIRTNSVSRVGGSHKKRDIGFIGGGAAGGVLVGAVAAGGRGA
jgi:hypothetical protein